MLALLIVANLGLLVLGTMCALRGFKVSEPFSLLPLTLSVLGAAAGLIPRRFAHVAEALLVFPAGILFLIGGLFETSAAIFSLMGGSQQQIDRFGSDSNLLILLGLSSFLCGGLAAWVAVRRRRSG